MDYLLSQLIFQYKDVTEICVRVDGGSILLIDLILSQDMPLLMLGHVLNKEWLHDIKWMGDLMSRVALKVVASLDIWKVED